MSQGGKLTPNLDQQSTKILNLTVLQRIDPCIEEILMTAAHVTFYVFNVELNQWSRKDVEGSLFVVKRNSQPRFQFIVMNRRNTDNLVENLLDFEYETQVPYLLYRNAAQEVNGIWFYNSRECEDVANLFNRILSAYSKVPPKPKVSSTKSEFEELERVPTTNVIEGPLEPSSATSTAADIPEDSSFVNFFSSALNIGANASNLTRSQPCHSPVPVPLFSREPSIVPSLAVSPQVPIPSLPSSAASLTTPLSFHDTHDPISNSNRVTNLVKPSSFSVPPSTSSILMTSQVAPISSSMPTTATHPPLNLQHQYVAPMLHPFPPPNPPASLAPSATFAPNYGPVISRDKVRDALQMLAQDNQFIEIFYQALMRVHNQ